MSFIVFSQNQCNADDITTIRVPRADPEIHTAAFVSTPRECPSIPRVVWGVCGHSTLQDPFKKGVGVRNFVGKISDA